MFLAIVTVIIRNYVIFISKLFFYITVTNCAMHGLVFRFSSPVSTSCSVYRQYRLTARPCIRVAAREFLCTCLDSISRIGPRSNPLRHVTYWLHVYACESYTKQNALRYFLLISWYQSNKAFFFSLTMK